MKIRNLILPAMLMPMLASAEITLPDIIADNMMLQQQSDARIWGWATPGSEITVSGSWAPGSAVTVKTAKNGRWDASVATPAASFTPQALTIKGDGSDITVKNVLIGEVWLCSGQSNMEMPLRGFWGQPVEGGMQAIAYSGRYPGIRVAKVPKSCAYQPRERGTARWMESNPTNAPEFSALGYFFARSLTDILGVPVGIIDCSYGGSKLESWMPREIVKDYTDIDLDKEARDTTENEWHRAIVRYNSMLHPLIGYTIRGFLWNQGESNVGQHDRYPQRMATLITDWRNRWGLGDLPFYMVELPAWNYGNPEATDAALFRECQHKAATLVPNAGTVCTSDLIYDYELEDVHASQKQPLGERMAFLAAAKTYGYNTIAHESPKLTSCKIDGNTARLRFDNVEGYLTPNDVLEGFEVAGADRVFHPAQAIMEPGSYDVVVTAPDGVGKIESVRYCFKNFARGKVHSIQGLPLIPFRTDNWER